MSLPASPAREMELGGRKTREMELGDLKTMVVHNWFIIVAVTLVGALAGLAWTLINSDVFESQAHSIVVTSVDPDLAGARAGDELAKSKAISYQALATSQTVAEKVATQTDWESNPTEMLEQVTIEVPAESAEIRITAEASSPADAAFLANTWMEVLSQQAQAVEAAIPNSANSQAQSPVALVVLDTAEEPAEPSGLSPVLSGAAGGLAGLLFGLTTAFIRTREQARNASPSQ